MNQTLPIQLPPSLRSRTVTAVLGPTNTGKTHMAIERMLAQPSGIIGLPLRLLAREVYGRLVEKAGKHAVALVTGEEKITPKFARYFVYTVEAMPRQADVDYVAIDEVQLAGDLERGHIFTDRILNLRGKQETLLLGAATIRPLLERLIPGITVVTRPRMSQLTYVGQKKLTRLPPRSAIVAFSAEEVYAIAELVKRQSGGAAVVLGALSPRTRNAQVDLYQNGDVDYLVATDAIGMGLNLDVTHISFAGSRKFDGYQYRGLTAAEFGQIAGRAGRHTRDGTFGVTGRVAPFEDELVQQLETHAFQPMQVLQWRNPAHDFTSIPALMASLDVIPREPGLTRAPGASDQAALEHVARNAEIYALAQGAERVELLWEVCKVPDYRRIAPANHADLVATLFAFVAKEGRIPDDWFRRQVAEADVTDGGIDTLAQRIAHIRTWTYVANRNDWLRDPSHWRQTTRAIEDRLSDALHERLTQRFVDRRTSVLMRRLRENAMLEAEITQNGDVMVEGHRVGHMDGFRFAADATGEGLDAKALKAAAAKALAGEIEARAERFSRSGNPDFVLSADGTIRWLGQAVARLIAGETPLSPGYVLLADEQLTGPAKDKVDQRLTLWIRAQIDTLLKPLIDLRDAADLEGIAKGVAFQLVEALGTVERQQVAEDVKALDQTMRATLRKYGVRFGAYHVFMPLLLKPAPSSLVAQLWALKHDSVEPAVLTSLAQLSLSGRTSIPVDATIPKALYRNVGYRVCGTRAVRIDILERLADLIRPLIAWKPIEAGVTPPTGAIPTGGGFTITVAMTSLVGCAGEDFTAILKSLGYRMEKRTFQKPAAPVVAQAAAAEIAAEETPAETVGEAETTAPETVEPVAEAEAPEVVETAVEAVEAPEVEAAAEPVAETPSEASTEVAAEAEAETPAETPVEPETVELEVWRPGRFERREGQHQHHRGGRNHHGGQHRGDRPQGERQQGDRPHGDRPQGDRPQGERNQGDRPRRQDGDRFKGWQGRGNGEGNGRPGGDRGPRPQADRPEGGRPQGDRHQGDRHQDQRRDDRPRKDARPEKPMDPNSPFAKLAALKAQMEEKGKK